MENVETPRWLLVEKIKTHLDAYEPGICVVKLGETTGEPLQLRLS